MKKATCEAVEVRGGESSMAMSSHAEDGLASDSFSILDVNIVNSSGTTGGPVTTSLLSNIERRPVGETIGLTLGAELG